MNEYIITRQGQFATISGKEIQWTLRIGFATVFRSKDRASAIAKRVNGFVEPFYGAPIAGMKSFVSPKQSPVNRRRPYRAV